MKQCGFTATIYLVTSRIKDKPLQVEGVDYLSWSDVRELQRQGIRFGSHTVALLILALLVAYLSSSKFREKVLFVLAGLVSSDDPGQERDPHRHPDTLSHARRPEFSVRSAAS